jgi:two-component system sensor histidine kinase KdpD
LTAVVGFLSELRAGDLDPEIAAEVLDIAATQAIEVGYLIEDLLVSARAENGQIALDLGPVQLGATVLSVFDGLPAGGRPEMAKGEIAEVTALADAKRLRQIVRNLFVNVLHHGGGSCRVDVGVTNGTGWIRVVDDGPGIAPEDRESVFEPYRSVGGGSGPLPSIGLGLTVSRQLARLMGGDVVYEGEPRSAFVVSLPVAAG